MSYSFNFSPRFLKRKQEILSLKTTPEIELADEIESCLKTDLEIPLGMGALWLACIKATQRLLVRSVCISSLIAVAASGATFFAMQLLGSGQKTSTLIAIAFAYFTATICMQMGTFFNNRVRNAASHAVHALLINLISQKLLRLSSRAKARQTSGNLKVLITSDTFHVAEFVDNFIRNFIPAIVALFIVLPFLVHLTGTSGLAGVLIMVSFLPLSAVLNWTSQYFQNKSQTALDTLATLLGEWVKNIRLIRYLSWDDSFQNDIIARLRKFINYSTYQHLLACLIFGLSVSWWMVSVVGVFLVARWTQIPMDLHGFFGSLWLITFLSGYFTHLPNTIRLYGEAKPSIRRISRLLSEEEQRNIFESESSETPPTQGKPKRVHFKNVSFGYATSADSSEKIILKDLTLTLELKRKLAVVGEVASGKSTFLKLLCGELPPTQGQILIEFDDGSIHSLWKNSCHEIYRKHLAWVPQEPFISSDRLSTNISLISSTEETALVEAAYWAELEADLLAFPNGVHEEIGEGGINLSGGQKQRLNIARAYFSNRSYLVLDDALSAVDSMTELALMKRLESHSEGFILVTHRTSELMRMEEILVMKNGSFIERGDPKVLSADPSTNFSKVLSAYKNEVSHV